MACTIRMKQFKKVYVAKNDLKTNFLYFWSIMAIQRAILVTLKIVLTRVILAVYQGLLGHSEK